MRRAPLGLRRAVGEAGGFACEQLLADEAFVGKLKPYSAYELAVRALGGDLRHHSRAVVSSSRCGTTC
jgi:hypothetical protein